MSGFDKATANEVYYDVSAETVEMCADEYVAISTEAWVTTPLNTDAGSFSLDAQCWNAGPCMLTETTLGPTVFDIQPVHLDNEGPIIVFEKVLAGFEYSDRVGGDIYYGPGPIYVLGHKQRGRSIGTRMTMQEFYVPRGMVGFTPEKQAPNTVIHPPSLIGRIVHAEWEAAFNSAKNSRGKLSSHVFERLAAAIKISLGVNPRREDVRNQSRELLFREIQRFIVTNLDSPDLSVDLVLAQHGVSRASLYRMFDSYGGIRTYITNLRASKAMIGIWQNATQRGIVQSMQTQWAFKSGNDFNRTVRRLFGNTPKRLISRALSEPQNDDLAAGFSRNFILQRWSGVSEGPTGAFT
ncbi:MAG: hypothetical protein HRT80_00870 [Henriciella sp.]|nr:hypothetical protein [Henriciella sp.]